MYFSESWGEGSSEFRSMTKELDWCGYRVSSEESMRSGGGLKEKLLKRLVKMITGTMGGWSGIIRGECCYLHDLYVRNLRREVRG